MSLKSICVYCGSNSGRQPIYLEQARIFAQELVRRDLTLVYGGARRGIMGMLADTVLAEGGRAVGVIPESLVQKEMAHPSLTELHVVSTIAVRKQMMAELADAFVALPGSVGTFEELFETWTQAQLGFHQKPCGLLNVGGYYDKLALFLDHTVEEGFMREEHRAMLAVESDAATLLDRFDTYRAPTVSKWIK